MKRSLLLFAHLFFSVLACAQYAVRFIVREKTSIKHDSIFITGSFRNWDPSANVNYLMKSSGADEKSIVLNLQPGKFWYKYTRGDWHTVEKQYSGWEMPDRAGIINKDTTLTDSVEAWRDELVRDKLVALYSEKNDTNRVNILISIINTYALNPEHYNSDSALFYAREALLLLQKIKINKENKAWIQTGYLTRLINIQKITAGLLHTLGNYPKALELRLENLQLAENAPNKFIMLAAILDIITDYAAMKDYQKVLNYGRLMQSLLKKISSGGSDFNNFQLSADYNISNAYYHLHLLDSSLFYARKVYDTVKTDNDKNIRGFVCRLLGDIYAEMEDMASASLFYRLAIPAAARHHAFQTVAGSQVGLARLFQKNGQIDSALFYARLSLTTLKDNEVDVQAWGENANIYIAEITPFIAALYKARDQPDSAYKYLRLSVDIRDSLYNLEKLRQFQNLTFNESMRQQQELQASKEAKQQFETRIKLYGLITGLLAMLLITFILFRNNRQKQKTNLLLEDKKLQLEQTLSELKEAQGQLIQSEKMASLGELTAGIAHEIQNPLNFVSNFSEVNIDLTSELKDGLNKITIDEKEKISFIETVEQIVQNEQKINHHSKRAEAIVKAMLQHSRAETGKKQPTDINALADEYLRLSYHGMRAKDRSFNAALETDFDAGIGKIDINQQDIGRALLNLFTNAFFAVTEKKKEQGEAYQPIVSVSTKRIFVPSLNGESNSRIIIRVRDNGKGIPEEIIDKIFHPFFTTKPSGQGTGLGLSLSYDIVKAHGGELKVESNEGQSSVFTIALPDV